MTSVEAPLLGRVPDALTGADTEALRINFYSGKGEMDAWPDPQPDDRPEASYTEPATPLGLVAVPGITGTPAAMGMAAVKWAEAETGTTEQPAFSNLVPYWLDMKPSWNGNPWCGAFVADAWARQGVDLRLAATAANPYYCPYLEAMAKKYGAWRPVGSGYSPKPGDFWTHGASIASHTGLAAPSSASYSGYRTVEGNTMPSSAGSQTNGNGAYVRYRPTSFFRGWCDMSVLVPALQNAGVIPQTITAPVITSGTIVPATGATPAKKGAVSISFSKLIAGIKAGNPTEECKVVQKSLNLSGCTKAAGYSDIPVDGRWTRRTQYAFDNYRRRYGASHGFLPADYKGLPGTETLTALGKWRNLFDVEA